jgi:hypothetical protein
MSRVAFLESTAPRVIRMFFNQVDSLTEQIWLPP